MKYLIVGHGEFPQGVESAIALLLGDKAVDSINLTAEKSHQQFKEEVNQYLQNNEDVIIFADLTGGAPHQIVAEILHQKTNQNWFLISNITLSIVMEICLMVQMEKNSQNYETIIQNVIETAKKSILVLKDGNYMTPAEIAAYIMVALTLVTGLIFMVILPLLRKDAVKKERKKHEVFLNNLKIGSKVILIGGLYGTIITINDIFAEIEVADKMIVKVDRDSIIAKQRK